MSNANVAELRRKAAFDALIDSVASAPLVRIPSAGYLYADDEGMAYSERRPNVEPMVAVYTFDALQQAFAVGRGMTKVDEVERRKSEQRGFHEYNSWKKNIPAMRKRAKSAEQYLGLRGAANILRAMNFHGLATEVERARAELCGNDAESIAENPKEKPLKSTA